MGMFIWWIASNGLVRQGFCRQWKSALVRLHAISDTMIVLTCFLIPLARIYFVRRRRDLPFDWMSV
jgi:hypothetical protein